MASGLECVICFETAHLPFFTLCENHHLSRFCSICIVEMMEKDCYLCRGKIKRTVHDFSTESVAKDVVVKCEHRDNNPPCEWEGTISQHTIHRFKFCPYSTSQCDLCQETIFRKDNMHHFLHCPNRIVRCDYCRELFMLCNLEYHQAIDCNGMTFYCEMLGKNVPREYLATLEMASVQGAIRPFDEKMKKVYDFFRELKKAEFHLPAAKTIATAEYKQEYE